ncbi:2OG-Fe(II) oxygenase superfamily, putative [Trypanosoma equiperdum]|uniref:Fe2OG dioxygenase domain-containing protein n=2 Tax=Trypanozoon TaxID=39700 RepID=Q383I2_TRYB2|nr:hypothetical protein, conserved [Trypanosoma brucei brucei TREU927]EAN80049.1 hypothetical protein, conserved [Trypanosoma brucei brucei TREU927]SCU70454.1 2OG-Fe(II) oxygenase superfamily, putative [Trypanosoma equiperdum]
MRRCLILPVLTTASKSSFASCRHSSSGDGRNGGLGSSASSSATTIRESMKSAGFNFNTPNFCLEGATESDVADTAGELITSPVTSLNFVRDMYGPWLVLTEEIQGELFIDHDKMVYLRPANGLGFGVGRIDTGEPCSSGTAFLMSLEWYTYPATTSMPPNNACKTEVTGVVKHVHSSSMDYSTFTLVASWRSSSGTSGKFNAAKLSPWDPVGGVKRWTPNGDLMQVFHQVFPTPLRLTSHIKRATAARQVGSRSGGLGEGELGSSPHHLSLEQYRVGELPDLYYIPNYISEEEEQEMMEAVRSTPRELKTQLTKRTVQEWGCSMCETCNKSFVSDRNMPPWVEACTDMQVYDGIFTPSVFPNSVRVHEYHPHEGIAPHCDGPIYVPRVSVLSLGTPCVMFFYSRREPYSEPMEHYNDTFRFKEGIAKESPIQSVVLEPRSLLVFAGDVFHYYPHGTCDRKIVPLTTEVAGRVVNRHLLQDPDIKEVHKGFRVSVTTRNLLPRCNHQPERTEYGMKRAWFIYNQLPVPQQLFTSPPLAPDAKTGNAGGEEKAKPFDASAGKSAAGSAHPGTDENMANIEKKLDQLLKQQNALSQQLDEVRQLIAGDAGFRHEVSTVLGHLTSTVLQIESKLEELEDNRAREMGETGGQPTA